MKKVNAYVHDTDQNCWELASIQSTALGLPGMLIGGQIARLHGPCTAILSVLTGNLVLWGIAYAIVSMSFNSRVNAIENVKKYIGVWPCLLGALILAIGFLSWSLVQNQSFVISITPITKWNNETLMNLGAFFLFITAIFSYGNIRLIKKFCVISFPFLFLYSLFNFFAANVDYREILAGQWDISLWATVAIVAQNLPGIINLPTFFRHARSKPHALLGLTLMTIFVSFFQIFSIVTNIANPSEFFSRLLPFNSGVFDLFFSITFIALSTFCVNLVNIYFASAGWEAISNILRSSSVTWNERIRLLLQHILIPHTHKYEKAIGIACVINGLFATALFRIVPHLEQIEFAEGIADNSLASLGVVLVPAFIIKILEGRSPKPLEKAVSGITWLLGSYVAIYTQFETQDIYLALVEGASTSLLVYLTFIFLEIAFKSFKKIFKVKIESNNLNK